MKKEQLVLYTVRLPRHTYSYIVLVLPVLREVYCAKLPSQSTVHYATPVFDVDLTHPLQMPQVSGEPSLVRVVVQSFSASWVVLELRKACWIVLRLPTVVYMCVTTLKMLGCGVLVSEY